MAAMKSRNDKILRWALGLSLGTNLLIVGLVAGTAYRFSAPHMAGGGYNMHEYGTPYLMAMPSERRREIFQDVRASNADKFVTKAARRGLYDQALATLRTDPFDIDAMKQVLKEQRTTTLNVQQMVQDAWLDEIAQMDKASRNAYADRLQAMLEGGPMHGGGRMMRDN